MSLFAKEGDSNRRCKEVRVNDAAGKLSLAMSQLERVQMAWDPPDCADLSHYGFHALENAVDAACLHLGRPIQRTHPARPEAALWLHATHDFEDVSSLLRDLNETRKSESYGDVEAPELDAQETAAEIETFVEAIHALLGA